MPPHKTKETLKGCNQLPGLSKKDTTNGKASLSNLPQLSQEGYISSVTKVVLFPHFQPSKTNEKERQRDTESIRYVTGGPTGHLHWKLVQAEPNPMTKCESGLMQPPLSSSLHQGIGKEELGSSSYLRISYFWTSTDEIKRLDLET